jgi:hypothetical protein
MKKLAVIVAALVVVPAPAAFAAELGGLMDGAREANYSAEQIISCSTPDGVRDAVVRIRQSGGELRVSSNLTDDVEVAVGAGTWSMRRGGELVSEASVGGGETTIEPLYSVEEERAVEYLGRAAMSYLLIRDGTPRAELVFDDDTGVLVDAVTYSIDGEVYCERRFVSLDAGVETSTEKPATTSSATPPSVVAESTLPDSVAGFERLDEYEDEDGVRFAYYSDGFFSFAVFQMPTTVALPEAKSVSFESGEYQRVFTAGQVTYVWETRDGAAALVGDLPPDLHEAVLGEMPHPHDPGFFRRVWRTLFG